MEIDKCSSTWFDAEKHLHPTSHVSAFLLLFFMVFNTVAPVAIDLTVSAPLMVLFLYAKDICRASIYVIIVSSVLYLLRL